jgi:signal transduction histidine kinase
LVEVVGFPSLAGPSPVLREAWARKFGAAPIHDARPLNAENLFRPENDAVRVYVEAVLLNRSEDRRTLELQTGLQRFVARFDGGGELDSSSSEQFKGINLSPGSRLGLTGVYAGSGRSGVTGTDVANFELLLSSPADIRVLASPPFLTLERSLVLVGALLGVLCLALVWIRLLHHRVQLRTAQLQAEVRNREQAEQQHALAQERARIARDLHDDLGSSLTEISMLATAGPGLNLPPGEAAERMQAIAGRSRTLVNALDEIVWAIDPERDTLASVIRYLASYTEDYLTGLKVACRVQIPNSSPDFAISGEVRHHLFLAIKESLSNAVRHGAATEISFQARLEYHQLMISIADNGRGFDPKSPTNGHGLANLRDRIERLHGRCDWESSPGKGTTIRLQLPLDIPDSSPLNVPNTPA